MVLLPFGTLGQALLAGALGRMIIGAGIAATRAEEVFPPALLEWPAPPPAAGQDQQELKQLLTQARRGTIDLSRRIDSHPDSADLFRRRGILYARLASYGQATPGQAVEDLTRAREKGSAAPGLDYELARAHLAALALTKAQASADAHLQQQPTDARAYVLKASAELRRTKGEHVDHCRRALADLNQALALDSTLLAARMMRGYALAATDQFPLAVADYRRALAAAPQNPQVHFFLAEALLGMNNAREACQHLTLAEAFAPRTTKSYRKKHCR